MERGEIIALGRFLQTVIADKRWALFSRLMDERITGRTNTLIMSKGAAPHEMAYECGYVAGMVAWRNEIDERIHEAEQLRDTVEDTESGVDTP